jgi:hypothetical protein
MNRRARIRTESPAKSEALSGTILKLSSRAACLCEMVRSIVVPTGTRAFGFGDWSTTTESTAAGWGAL